jgi:hypothetical protein
MRGEWRLGDWVMGEWVIGVLYFVKRVPRVRRFLFGGMTIEWE